MCGIAGIVGDPGCSETVRATVRRMISLQRHRGPDGEGYHDSVGASLGHCRLAIIDLGPTGRQPMSDAEGRYWITFNGEIYNYLELAEELRALGHCFRGESDTEVLLAAYRQWGEGCLGRLRGMFAFAIWDEKERSIFAGRDRLGIKPFHYWTDGAGRLAFASELKALIQFLPTRQVNLRLAQDFLAWDILDHDSAETMLVGIKRLPPAHSLTWSSQCGLHLQPFWHVAVSDELDTPRDQQASLAEEFRRRFEETVSLHLRSDVPVGTCLSGGLDSSSIACVVSAELRRRGQWRDDWQHTFSACFADPRIDERRYISEVATHTGCKTHFVFPQGERMREELDTWLWHQEEPVASCGAYSQYCVARLAKEKNIKVLLDGQGADEQLAGYRKFLLVYLRQLMSRGHYLRACSEAAAFVSSPAILKTISLVDGRRYFRAAPGVELLWPGGLAPPRPAMLDLGDSLGRRVEADLFQISLPLLLRYEDRNTMAFGVESRVPFVDHVLVEWLAGLSADMRLARGWTKRILRDGLVGVLPERVRRRKSKLGFATPESEWLKGPLFGWLNDSLSAPRHLGEVAELTGVEKLFSQYRDGFRSPSLAKILFRLAIYESWARQFLVPHLPVKEGAVQLVRGTVRKPRNQDQPSA